MATRFNGSIAANINFGKWVGQYVALRDKLKDDDETYRQHRKQTVDAMKTVEDQILTALDATGQESARTEFGTASITVNHYASCSDPDAFVDFVRQNDAWELMERRAASVPCRAWEEEHGQLPPGVKINSVRGIGVRRAS
jgi:hypothetical protein